MTVLSKIMNVIERMGNSIISVIDGLFSIMEGSEPSVYEPPNSGRKRPILESAALKPTDPANEKLPDVQPQSEGTWKPKDYKYIPPPEIPFQPHFARTRTEVIFQPRTPTVYLTPDAYKRMCLYVELAPLEVGWLGTLQHLDNGDFLIEEVFLVEQKVMAAETELSVVGIEKLLLELIESGDAGFEKANKLHFWGHSHVRMPTNPSFTDENTMRRFAGEGHEFYVRGIFNKLGKANFDVYYCKEGLRLLDVPWAVRDTTSGAVLLEHRRSDMPWTGNFSLAPTQPPEPAALTISPSLRTAVQVEYALKVEENVRTTIGLFDWLLSKQTPEPPAIKDEKTNEQS